MPDFAEYVAAVRAALKQAGAPATANAFVDKFSSKLEQKYQLLADRTISLSEFRDGIRASGLLPTDQRLGDWLVDLLATTAARLLEIGTARAKPPAPPSRPKQRRPDILDSEEFDLGIGRGGGGGGSPSRGGAPRKKNGEPKRAAKPVAGNGGGSPRPERIVSTGFARPEEAGGGLEKSEPLKTTSRYFYWLEIGPRAAPHALAPSNLPADVPAKAELTVVLFAPDGDLVIEHDACVGWLHLHRDGTATVSQRPGPPSAYEQVPKDVLDRRLLFPVRTPELAGRYRMRVSIYRRGVLVESRLTTLSVGTPPPPGLDALAERVDYSLSQRYAASTLDDMAPHELSIMINS